MPQGRGDLFQVGLLPYRHRLGSSVDFRSIGENRSLETLLDNPVVLHIKIGKGNNEDKGKEAECGERKSHNGISEAALPSLTVLSVRNSDFNGHVG